MKYSLKYSPNLCKCLILCIFSTGPEVTELLVFLLGVNKKYKQVSAEMSFNFSFCNYTQNINVVKIFSLRFFLCLFSPLFSSQNNEVSLIFFILAFFTAR